MGSEDDNIEENMWFLDDFKQYTKKIFNEDIWEESVLPLMKKVIISSLECVQTRIIHRTNSFELFGYDIMIDEDHKPWLIEVNKFPTLEHSTHVTSNLVPRLMRDMCKLLIDEVDK